MLSKSAADFSTSSTTPAFSPSFFEETLGRASALLEPLVPQETSWRLQSAEVSVWGELRRQHAEEDAGSQA